MTDQPSLKQFLDELSNFNDEDTTGGHVPAPAQKLEPIGSVLEIAGSGSRIRMNPERLAAISTHPDQSVAMSGQVGSQVKRP